jgi:hypothetical protein
VTASNLKGWGFAITVVVACGGKTTDESLGGSHGPGATSGSGGAVVESEAAPLDVVDGAPEDVSLVPPLVDAAAVVDARGDAEIHLCSGPPNPGPKCDQQCWLGNASYWCALDCSFGPENLADLQLQGPCAPDGLTCGECVFTRCSCAGGQWACVACDPK